jgi:hypothetical protein
MRFVLAGIVLIAATACTKSCPEIGCVPSISISYSAPITTTYRLKVSVQGNDYPSIDCPASAAPPLQSAITCDESKFTVQGPELFLGSTPPSQIAVQVGDISNNAGALVTNREVSAHTAGSINGDGCDMNCYRAEGTLDLSP